MSPTSTLATSDIDRLFHELVSVWNSHQDLRRSGAPIADLAMSRWALEEARTALR